MKSLNEVVNMVGLSRRTIQEYESASLAKKPTTKNKYGHLMYDTPEIERLWQLKFYYELGYKIPDIKKIQEKKGFDSPEELNKIINELKAKAHDLDNIIKIAETMKECEYNLNDFNILRKSIFLNDEATMTAKTVFEIMAAVMGLQDDDINKMSEEDILKMFKEDTLSDKEWFRIFAQEKRIMKKRKSGQGIQDEDVQKGVRIIHKIVSKDLSDSILVFRGIALLLTFDIEFKREIEEEYGEGSMDFFVEAIEFYCNQHIDNPTDQELYDAFENLEKLARSKHRYSCEEVQAEVRKVHMYFNNIKIYTDEYIVYRMRAIEKGFSSQAYKNLIDNGSPKGFSWFISKAFEVYLKNLEQENI